MNYKIIITIFLLQGCTVIKLSKKQEYLLKEQSTINFELNNFIYIPVKVNGKNTKFIFDTGSSSTVITDSSNCNLSNTKSATKKAKSHLGSSKYTMLVIDSFELQNLIALNKLVYYTDMSKVYNICNPQFSYYGIIGTDIMKKFKSKRCLINFDKNEILSIDNDSIINNQYEIVSENFNFFTKLIYLPISVEGKLTNFLFDTGFKGGLLLTKDSISNKIDNYNMNSLVADISGSKIKSTIIYKNVDIKFSKINFQNCDVRYCAGLNKNIVGMDFIKYFNWIIDFQEKKLYAKKNNLKFENTTQISPLYKTGIINNFITIVENKINNETKYLAGQIIQSIDGIKITTDNICYYNDILNGISNWDSLNIVVVNTNYYNK